jgi:hypothetical protein
MCGRFTLGIKNAAVVSLVGFLVTLLPSAPASATLDKTVQGSNPHGAFCRTLYPNGEKLPVDGILPPQPKHQSLQALRATVLTFTSREIKQYQLLLHKPSGAPSKVRKEIPAAIAFLQETKSQYPRLKTPSQFESAKTPKDFHAGFGAETALLQYIVQECGGITSESSSVTTVSGSNGVTNTVTVSGSNSVQGTAHN